MCPARSSGFHSLDPSGLRQDSVSRTATLDRFSPPCRSCSLVLDLTDGSHFVDYMDFPALPYSWTATYVDSGNRTSKTLPVNLALTLSTLRLAESLTAEGKFNNLYHSFIPKRIAINRALIDLSSLRPLQT